MADYFLVSVEHGPDWDDTKPRRQQAHWDEHAVYMNEMEAEGSVVLGGPIGEGDGDDVLLVVDLPDEATIRARLSGDPWFETVLHITSIRPWTVLLRAPSR